MKYVILQSKKRNNRIISPKHSIKTPNIIPGKDDGLDEAKEREFEAKSNF